MRIEPTAALFEPALTQKKILSSIRLFEFQLAFHSECQGNVLIFDEAHNLLEVGQRLIKAETSRGGSMDPKTG